MPLIDLGLDSLMAVDVRTWFLQELGVDLPVLKILGGASVAELVNDAVEKLPQDLLSKLSTSESQDGTASAHDDPAKAAISQPSLEKQISFDVPSGEGLSGWASTATPSIIDSDPSIVSVLSSSSSAVDISSQQLEKDERPKEVVETQEEESSALAYQKNR